MKTKAGLDLTQKYVEELEQQNKMLIEVVDLADVTLSQIENYLHHNTDNLCGDDCIGDKKLTMRFENRIIQIQKAIETLTNVKKVIL